MQIRLPNETTRTTIIARTGSGKSVLGFFLLSTQNFLAMPWIIIDYKGDPFIAKLIKALGGAVRHIKVTDKPPKVPGLYYMHPRAMIDDEAMEAFLLRVHAQGEVGLYIDEGYALPNMGKGAGLTLILTQGRTLHIPVICLYQRPVWMSRFQVAQSDFICVLKQGDERDEKVTRNFVRPAMLPDGRKIGPLDMDQLPDYYSLWHDVSRGTTVVLQPVPDENELITRFKSRLLPAHKRELV